MASFFLSFKFSQPSRRLSVCLSVCLSVSLPIPCLRELFFNGSCFSWVRNARRRYDKANITSAYCRLSWYILHQYFFQQVELVKTKKLCPTRPPLIPRINVRYGGNFNFIFPTAYIHIFNCFFYLVAYLINPEEIRWKSDGTILLQTKNLAVTWKHTFPK